MHTCAPGPGDVSKDVHGNAITAKTTHLCVCVLSHVQLFVTPWTVSHQAPLSVGDFRQEDWSGLPCPPPGDLPDPGIEPISPATPASPAVQADSLLLSQTHLDANQIKGEIHIRIFTAQTPQRTARGETGMNTPAVREGRASPGGGGVSRSCVCLPREPWKVYKSLSTLGFWVSLTILGKFYPIWSFLNNLGNSSKEKISMHENISCSRIYILAEKKLEAV